MNIVDKETNGTNTLIYAHRTHVLEKKIRIIFNAKQLIYDSRL